MTINRNVQFLTAAALALLFSTPLARGQDSLHVGETAPEFTLPAATKDTILFQGIRLHDALAKSPVILAFYPADWSGGCTKEMCTMRDNFKALGDLGVTVLGISGDYVFSHHEWASRLGLPFALLSDHNHAVAKEYQSFDEKSGNDRRTVIVVDRKGILRYVDRSYNSQTADSFEKLQKALAMVKEG